MVRKAENVWSVAFGAGRRLGDQGISGVASGRRSTDFALPPKKTENVAQTLIMVCLLILGFSVFALNI